MPFPCEALIRTVAGKGRARLSGIPTVFKAAGLLLLVAGLARPVWRAENQSFQREGIDLFLLVDISSSMSEKVLDGTRSNLQVAGEVVKTFVQGRQSDRIGVISFARFPKLECPLTMEEAAVHTLIDRLRTVPRGSEMDGTAIGAALAEAARRFEGMGDAAGEKSDRVVILLTDGEENQFYVDPLEAARLCADLKIKVYTVASASAATGSVGAPVEGGPPGGLHEEIARITGGRFAEASSPADLGAVFDGIDALEKRPLEERYYVEVYDLFRWFLVPAAALLFLEFLLARSFYLRMP
jgi:Ca-activated chloride channel family protein